MKVIEAGHIYQLNWLDGEAPLEHDSSEWDFLNDTLVFVERQGEGYPGNTDHHAGTQIQEVLRALIDRTKYLNNQIPHVTNLVCIDNMRNCIYMLEHRAAERHRRVLPNLKGREIESIPTCPKCGHIFCEEHK